jgi:carbohydrate diacid regulator
MEYISELEKSLQELKHITGLSLDIHAETKEEMEQAVRQVRLLCSAYRSKYDKIFFLQELLNGQILPSEIQNLATKFHIQTVESRVLFLLEGAAPLEGIATEVLKNLFPNRTNIFLIPIDLHRIAILQSLKKKNSLEAIRKTAYTILDTLSTEALISVKISYSKKMNSLEELPKAFQDSCTALKIGKIFNTAESIYPCDKLGIGQLLYRLPVPLCENFLSEIFGDNLPSSLDDELLNSVDAFFQNNLNIAETARQLHMHRNTFIYRLEQIEKITGLDLRIFEDAVLFKVASMVIHYLQTERSTHP